MSRKEEILDAVIEIFQTRGIQTSFTISEIARKVDIGKSTIYEYFKTKDEILSEAVMRVFSNSVVSVANREVTDEDTFEVAFKKEMNYVLTLAKSSSFIFEFLTSDFKDTFTSQHKGILGERMKSAAQKYQDLFIHIVQKGIAEGVLSEDKLELRGMIFASLIAGSITRMGNINVPQTNELDITSYVDELFEAVIKIFN